MRLSATTPTITDKWPIEVPTNTYGSPCAVYKVWFGKSYLVWKGKSLHQSAQQLAESIERYFRLQKDNPEDYLYHVCNHIRKTRCQKGKIEVIGSDFIKNGTESSIDVYKVLMLEQDLLKEAAGDPNCLNNNEQAYVAKWMEEKNPGAVEKFLKNWNK